MSTERDIVWDTASKRGWNLIFWNSAKTAVRFVQEVDGYEIVVHFTPAGEVHTVWDDYGPRIYPEDQDKLNRALNILTKWQKEELTK